MKNFDLGKDKISKLLLNFSIPCIISMLVGALYNIVDQIFIGLGVGYILKDRKNIYKVFLYSDMENKVKRVVNYYGINKTDAKKEINLVNKNRAKHYEYYTGQKWNDMNNYDLAINVDKLGVVKTAETIKEILNNKN